MDEDIDIIRKATASKTNNTAKLRRGISMVVAALLMMLTGLTWNSVQATHNLSDVLNKRSPVIEYLACFNNRIVEHDLAVDNLILLSPHSTTVVDKEAVARAESDLRIASENLKEANTKGADGACPNIP